ncbi:TetR/AcrR family transcriptional regulator [Nonomuraea rosea]|uniref:TetR/AcrR family transcriptional regulator n=1 Tax=Nonomuraea rosea TaxID=638574 RepID=A0ABP6V5A4_9ACTN
MTVPHRADARHNRARVLAAAQAAFAEQGRAVPLDVIAGRAGVGAGTVYRHFPSKESLLSAVMSERIERLVAEIGALTGDSADPGATFFAAFERSVEQVVLNKALCESMASGEQVRVEPGVRERYLAALEPLLSHAQEAGAVRADVALHDVMTLIAGCATMRAAGGAVGTSVVMDGLKAATAVTKRNETRCVECGDPVPPAGTGRPARYCGNACRQRAHRRRHASG